MFSQRQKRLLALDGGGIMGAITLQALKRMEDQLRPYSGMGAEFRLCHFFDYFGGTSTGAIVATGLALGKSVDEIIRFYAESGRDMFQKSWLIERHRQKFDDRPLANRLKEIIGEETVLEMQRRGRLKSLLLVVTRNASNDSAWPLSTNPAAKYNAEGREDCNLKVPLWQLVRASTAAPSYFRHEVIRVGKTDRRFVDGGVTPYNNPAFLLFKMATLPYYKLGWPTGEDRLMLVSCGTGFARNVEDAVSARSDNLVKVAMSVPGELMRGIARENDMNCRLLGRCVHGPIIDREVGDMIPGGHLSQYLGRAFLYARYDADLSLAGLEAMGLADIDARTLTMDNVDALPDLLRIGVKAAEQVDIPRYFETFMQR